MNTFKVRGVDKDSGMDTEWIVDALDEKNARAKAELRGMIVTGVHTPSRASAAIPAVAAATPNKDEAGEDKVWSGHPSHWTGLRRYFWFAVLVTAAWITAQFYWQAWFGVGLFVTLFIWTFFDIRSRRYKLTTERLILTSGILSIRHEEIELFRVKDTVVLRPFAMRLVGLGSVQVTTTDTTTPSVIIEAIKQPLPLRERIRDASLRLRRARGIREIDIE